MVFCSGRDAKNDHDGYFYTSSIFYIIPDNFRIGNRKNARFSSKKCNNSCHDEQCGGFLQRRGERSGAPRFPLLRVPQQSRIWYNERSPRRAGMTGLDGTANTVLYEERKTYSRKEGTAPMALAGQVRPWEYVRERNPAGTRKDGWIGRPPSPGRRDHDNMCRKAILPAQENMGA